MTIARRSLALVAVLALAGAAAPVAAQEAPAAAAPASVPDRPFAEASPGGQSLVVPEEHRALGTVYHALPGRDRQVYFLSDAPFEKIEGQSRGVIGYVVAGKDAKAGVLAAGEWHLPVEAIRTGNTMRDRHMQQPNWLDAAQHPNVVFRLTGVRDVRTLQQAGQPGRTHRLTLVGDLTIKGVTRPIEIPDATVALRPAPEGSDAKVKGDLLAIRAKFDVRLADYGISNKVIVTDQRVAEVLNLDVKLYHSTVPPEEQEAGAAEEPEVVGS